MPHQHCFLTIIHYYFRSTDASHALSEEAWQNVFHGEIVDAHRMRAPEGIGQYASLAKKPTNTVLMMILMSNNNDQLRT